MKNFFFIISFLGMLVIISSCVANKKELRTEPVYNTAFLTVDALQDGPVIFNVAKAVAGAHLFSATSNAILLRDSKVDGVSETISVPQAFESMIRDGLLSNVVIGKLVTKESANFIVDISIMKYGFVTLFSNKKVKPYIMLGVEVTDVKERMAKSFLLEIQGNESHSLELFLEDKDLLNRVYRKMLAEAVSNSITEISLTRGFEEIEEL